MRTLLSSFTLCSVLAATVPTVAAAPRPTAAATQPDTAAPRVTAPTPASDEDAARYADAERRNPDVADFRGGGKIVIAGSTTALIVLLLILVIVL